MFFVKFYLFISFVFLAFVSRSQFTSIIQSTINTFSFVEINESAGVAIAGGINFIKSTDQGLTWSQMDLDGYEMPFTIFTYQSAAILDNSTYVLVGNDTYNKKAIVIRTEDGGNNWDMVVSSANNSYQYAQDIAANGATVIVATKNGVWRSVDYGQNFSFIAIAPNIALNNATTIEYLPHASRWVWKYQNNNVYESLNDGVTWSLVSIGASSTLNSKLNYSNNSGLWTNSTPNASAICSIFSIGNSGTIDLQLDFANLIVANDQFEEVFKISPTEYIATDGFYFYLLDASDTTLEQFSHSLFSQSGGFSSNVFDLAMGVTYGLAVGSQGAISRFDLSQNFDTRVDAEFILPLSLCPGASATLIPANSNVDSLEWYVNDLLVSTNFSFDWEAPISSTSVPIKLKIWKNGYEDSITHSVNIVQEIAPNQYNLTTNLYPCYGVSKNMIFQYVSGASNVSGSYTLCTYNGDTMFYNSPSLTYGFSFYSPPIYSNDTIKVYTARPQSCGYVRIDSIQYIVYAGINMAEQFEYFSSDSVICGFGGDVAIELTDLNPTLTYNLTDNIFTAPISFSGIQDTTLNINLGISNGLTFGNYSQNWIDYYLTVTGSNGCGSGVLHLDSFQLINPNASFKIEPQAYLLNDTADITNQLYAFYNEWSGTNPLISINNINDTTPIVTSNQNAIGQIILANNPTVGCSDSTSRDIYFGEATPNLPRDVCFSNNAIETAGIVDIVMDNLGNTIEISTKNQGTISVYAGRAIFNIAKRDQNGNLLWMKSPLSSGSHTDRCFLIEKVIVDNDNNIYATMRWNWGSSINYEMLNISNSGQATRAVLVKLDGQTGNMLWYTDIQQELIDAGYSTQNDPNSKITHVTDFELAPEGIYFGTQNGVGLMKYNGDILSFHRYIIPYTIQYFPGGVSNSISGNASLFSPEIEILCTGEVLVLFSFRGTIIFPISYNTSLTLGPGSYKPTSVMSKYSYLFGFSNQEVVASGSILQNDLKGKTFFQKDANNNLLVAYHATEVPNTFIEEPATVEIMDSIYFEREMTVLLCIDKNNNEQWQKKFTGFEIGAIQQAKESNEIYISGTSYGSVAQVFNNTASLVVAANNEINSRNSPFIAKLSSQGELMEGRMWYHNADLYAGLVYQNRLALSPCGDMVWFLKPNILLASEYPMTLNSYGDEISLVAPSVIGLKVNCFTDDCSFAASNGSDTIYLCQDGDLQVILPISVYGNQDILYHLVENSTELPSVTTQNNTIVLTNETTQVVVESPINHTYEVILDQYLHSFDYDSLWCDTTGYFNITALPNSNLYVWGMPHYSTTNGLYSNLIYMPESLGDYVIPVYISTPSYCQYTDTVSYTIGTVIDPSITNYFSVGCDDSLVVAYNVANYNDNENWYINGSSTTNLFTETNLDIGINNLIINLMSNTGCTWSQTVTIDYCEDLGVNEKSSENSLFILPNPTVDKIYIESKSPIYSIRLLSLEGKEVWTIESNGSMKMDVSLNTESGMYWLIVQTEENIFKRSVIVKK